MMSQDCQVISIKILIAIQSLTQNSINSFQKLFFFTMDHFRGKANFSMQFIQHGIFLYILFLTLKNVSFHLFYDDDILLKRCLEVSLCIKYIVLPLVLEEQLKKKKKPLGLSYSPLICVQRYLKAIRISQVFNPNYEGATFNSLRISLWNVVNIGLTLIFSKNFHQR